MLTMNLPRPHHRGQDMTDWEVIEYEVIEKTVKLPHEVMDAKKIITMLRQ